MADFRDKEPPSHRPPEPGFEDLRQQELSDDAEAYAIELGCSRAQAFEFLQAAKRGDVPGKRPRTDRLNGRTASAMPRAAQRMPLRSVPAAIASTPPLDLFGDDVGALFARATSGAGKPLPHREQLERAFGEDLSDVELYTGRTELREIGAHGAAKDNKIATVSEIPISACWRTRPHTPSSSTNTVLRSLPPRAR